MAKHDVIYHYAGIKDAAALFGKGAPAGCLMADCFRRDARKILEKL